VADSVEEAWRCYLAGWLHAQGKTEAKELSLAWAGLGGENQLKLAFHQWYAQNEKVSVPAYMSQPAAAPASLGYRCGVPMCGESGVCGECRRRGAR